MSLAAGSTAAGAGVMRFGEAVLWCLSNYATFSGRAGRHEFWWFALFAAGGWTGLWLVAAEMPHLAPAAHLLVLALVPPLAAAAVRRLHDTGRPGWAALVALIPVAGVVALGVMLARRGEPRDNRYGDDPRYSLAVMAG